MNALVVKASQDKLMESKDAAQAEWVAFVQAFETKPPKSPVDVMEFTPKKAAKAAASAAAAPAVAAPVAAAATPAPVAQ